CADSRGDAPLGAAWRLALRRRPSPLSEVDRVPGARHHDAARFLGPHVRALRTPNRAPRERTVRRKAVGGRALPADPGSDVMRIVYHAGVWDLFHAGHLRVLEQSKKLGDVLIVGVVTDDGAAAYKPRRPVIPQHERLA